MATRDFDVPQEEPNISDIDSEKDAFNDETFGVDINDLEGNEFDFTSTNVAGGLPAENTKHGRMFPISGDEREDSEAFTNRNRQQQQQWNKPLTQGVIPSNTNDRHPKPYGQPTYFPTASGDSNYSPQGTQHPFRLNFAALSLANQQHQQKYHSNSAQRPVPSFNNEQQYPRRDYPQTQPHNYPHRQREYDNQSQNASFQPFSFTGNGYRRPEWDDDNSTQQHYRPQNQYGGIGRGSFQQFNNGNQPPYFRDRRGGYHHQNWQQREGYGGSYQQRGYHPRFDNADYDDRRDRGGRFHRHFDRRGPHDPFAGLMTWREKLTVLRIQLLQIISDRGSNFDDYYARMLSEKRKEQSLRNNSENPATTSTTTPENIVTQQEARNVSENEDSDSEERNRRRPISDRNRRRTVSASADSNSGGTQNTRNRIPVPRLSVVEVQPYRPEPLQNTLGKWTTTTVARPRQIIDCSAMQNLDDLQDSGGRKGESTAKLLIQALGSVERLYDFVLLAEDLERQIKLGPEPITPPDLVANAEGALRVGSFQSMHMPKPVDPEVLVLKLRATRLNITQTLCAQTRLTLILAIKKGRKILPRALKTLERGEIYKDNIELSLTLASILCEHLPLLIRREGNAAALIAVVTPLCSFVKGVIATRSSMVNPVETDDFLFTVRAILADKALSTRSPELVTLLASLVNVQK